MRSTKPVWHVLSDKDFMELLRRVASGEDPDEVYLEAYANAEHEDVSGNGDSTGRST